MKNQNKAGMVLSYISVILSCLTGMLLTTIIINILGDEQYGLYSIVTSLSSNMSILSFGLGTVVVRYVSECRLENKKKEEAHIVGTLFLIFMGLAILALIIGAVIYFKFNLIYNKSLSPAEIEQGKFMFIFAMLNVSLSLIDTTFNSCLVAYERYVVSRMESILKLILRLFITIPCVKFSASVTTIVILDLVITLVFFIFNIFYCISKLNIIPQMGGIEMPLLKRMFKYSFYSFLIMITNELNKNVDPTIIGIKMTSVAVAVYTAGRKISSIFDNISNAISSMFVPKATALVIRKAPMIEVEKFVIRMARIQLFVVMYVYLAFFALGDEFFSLWLGDRYHDAWVSALIIMSGLIFPLVKDSARAYVQSMEKQKFLSITYLINAIVNVISTWFAVDYFGIIGAAICSSVTGLICNEVIMNIYFVKCVGMDMMHIYKSMLNKMWISSLISLGAVWGLKTCLIIDSWLIFIINGAIYTLVYAVTSYIIGMNYEEKEMIMFMMRKLKR